MCWVCCKRDLHFKNFLLTDKTIYTLDGAQIKIFPQMLNKLMSIRNVALFLSQLGAGTRAYQEALFRHYAKSRGWLIKRKDINLLFELIDSWNIKRWQQYQRKIFRSSTDYIASQDKRSVSVCDRQYRGRELMQLIHDPESAFRHTSVKVLKSGRSATVVKVTLDQREWVVKRYNIKNYWHFLRRCFRPTRAANSWRLAQKLKLFHIATAKPVAFIEKRCLGLRCQSYYVMEYVSGEHIGEYLARYQQEENKLATMIKNIAMLLHNIRQLAITHGDLKMTNLLIDANEKPVLIDLDGAAEHKSIFAQQRAWQKEIKRFLQNFQTQPALLAQFKKELG